MEIDIDEWDMLPTQKLIYEDCYTDIIMHSSGLGGGKSHGLVRKSFQLSSLNKGYAGGFLSPSYASFKKDIKPLFEEILQEEMQLQRGKHWWFHGTDMYYSFIWNKKPLYMFTAEKPIAGPNLAYCLINEFSLMQEVRVNEMMRRVRVKGAPVLQKVLAGTPEDEYGWLEDRIELWEKMNIKKPDSFKLHISDTDENTNVVEGYGDYLTDTLDPLQLKIFKKGQIGNIGTNKFYYAFDTVKNRSHRTLNMDMIIYVNVDFNVDNMHCTINNIYYEGLKKYTHFVDEIVLKYNGADTYKLRQEIWDRFGHVKDSVIITVDASGRNKKTTGLSDVKVLREFFPNVRYRAAGNDRLKKRQILVNGLFNHGY